MDFEWSYWIEWGREHILWLLTGHLLVSQVSRLLVEKVCMDFLHSREFLCVSDYSGHGKLGTEATECWANPILWDELCEWVCNNAQVRVSR